MFTAPLVAGYVAGFVAATLVPRPAGLLAAVGWWVAILAASTAAIWLSRPVMQQFAPLSFLYQCSLVFPDDAPSRYSVALRRSQARDLARRVEAGLPLGDTPQEAAENILAILADLNDHDRKTRGHSERVRAYSDLIAENMGLPDDDRSMLHWAALLHDVGKLTVPAEILNKNGRPTDEEWMTLREHPGAAGPILEPLRPWLGEWLDAATQHHERHDGDGYPLGLAGSEISLAGRIVAVAEVRVPLLGSVLAQGVTIPGLELTLERGNGDMLASVPPTEELTGVMLAPGLSGMLARGEVHRAPARLSQQDAIVVTRPTLYAAIAIAASVPRLARRL